MFQALESSLPVILPVSSLKWLLPRPLSTYLGSRHTQTNEQHLEALALDISSRLWDANL